MMNYQDNEYMLWDYREILGLPDRGLRHALPHSVSTKFGKICICMHFMHYFSSKSTPKAQGVVEDSGQPVEEKNTGRCGSLTSAFTLGGEFIGIHAIISKSSYLKNIKLVYG